MIYIQLDKYLTLGKLLIFITINFINLRVSLYTYLMSQA